MKIIISPAKKMVEDTDSFDISKLPIFKDKAEVLLTWLKSKNYDELKNIWKCNDKIAKLNYDRIQDMNLDENLTPAVMAYSGIQYQAMGPQVFTQEALQRAAKDLYIISGFYGILGAMDGITPYRLEMQAKVDINDQHTLYQFWGDSIYQELYRDNELVVNLASKEYSKAIERYLKPQDKFITCSFKKEKNGKYVQQATAAKQARGDMVRYILENNIKEIDEIKNFSVNRYQYEPQFSTDTELVFIKN